jgi:hypothetical protein|tara:strand:+ start:234 stop:389 length:156 start_codon:yes stop_codon:yes gene_type:complete
MRLSCTEMTDLLVLSQQAQNLKAKKTLTEQEECVILWLNDKVKVLTEKKVR